MSEMERNKGMLYPVVLSELEGGYFEFCLIPTIIYPDSVSWILDAITNPAFSDRQDLDIFIDSKELYDDFIKLGDTYYVVDYQVKRDTNDCSFSDVKVNEDGTVFFHTYHYNGSGSLGETIEYGIKESQELPLDEYDKVAPKVEYVGDWLDDNGTEK